MSDFTPRINKRNLLVIASLVWLMAGTMVSLLGLEVLFREQKYVIISLIVAISVFYIFFNFIFKKMVSKHRDRISNKDQEKLCLFSFFDVKSYLIMAFMMTLGITIRSMSFINPLYWSPVYIGIGSALFVAGVLFFKEWLSWSNTLQSEE
ncbi:MAG: hypothetical protein ACRDA3_07155 [Peptostreptococcaceae bacterium]